MKALPAVVHAEYCGEFKIRIVFNDGVEGMVDFSDWLTGPVFERLKDRGYFARFFVKLAGSQRSTVNGWTSWKLDDGRTLAELREEYLHRCPR